MIAKSRKTRIGNKIRIQSDLTNFQIHFLDDFHDFCEFRLENDQIRISLFYLQVIVRWKHWDGCTGSCDENCKNDDQGSQPASTNQLSILAHSEHGEEQRSDCRPDEWQNTKQMKNNTHHWAKLKSQSVIFVTNFPFCISFWDIFG